MGYFTTTNETGSTVMGTWNEIIPNSIFTIGIGSGIAQKFNAMTVLMN